MALPTDFHVALRGWLSSHGVEAYEIAGVLVVRTLDELLRLSGSSRQLGSAERDLVAQARLWGNGYRDLLCSDGDPDGDERSRALGAQVELLLADVCRVLGEAGVSAYPWRGLGVVFGDEIFDVRVCIDDPGGLYELAHAAGSAAEPDWDPPSPPESDWSYG